MKRITKKPTHIHNQRHRKVLKPEVPHIEGNFDILCCDLSYACPGFALLRYHANLREVEILGKSHVKRTYHTQDGNYPGEILNLICREFESYLGDPNIKVVVRESSYVSNYHATEMMYRVVGAAELTLWNAQHKPFFEIAPATIKKIVAGKGNADKYDVEVGLEPYVGKWTYHTSDESDAVAVGVAWLIQNYYLPDLTEKGKKNEQDDTSEFLG